MRSLAFAALLSFVTRSLASLVWRGQQDPSSPAVIIEAPGDQLGEAITQQATTSTPCSCDCCDVQQMNPSKFVKNAKGQEVTSSCFKSHLSGDAAVGVQCPDQCQLDEGNEILSSASGAVDYDRYCNYHCQPTTDTAGDACTIFSSRESYAAATDPKSGGNGLELLPEPVLGVGSGGRGGTTPGDAGGSGSSQLQPGEAFSFEAGAPSPAAAAGPGLAGAPSTGDGNKVPAGSKAKTPVDKLQIVYDMRELIAERLRSETGAAVASGAASAERVRSNEYSTKTNSVLLKKMRVKLTAVAGGLEEGFAVIAGNQNVADEAEKKTKQQLVSARMSSSAIVKETRKLADEAIKKAVAPCSKRAAKDRAEAKGLDKPHDWVKVVAARAANPYQKAVSEAVQRTAEYKNLADGLMIKAFDAQKQANELMPHVNVLQAQGDFLGATIERKHVTNMLSRARALQEEAKGYWNTAAHTRETVPKWQMAASQAAAYATWEYSKNAPNAFR